MYELNALGKNGPDNEAMPLHVDAAGIQRDQNGIEIVPFLDIVEASPEFMAEWLKAKGMIPIKLGAL